MPWMVWLFAVLFFVLGVQQVHQGWMPSAGGVCVLLFGSCRLQMIFVLALLWLPGACVLIWLITMASQPLLHAVLLPLTNALEFGPLVSVKLSEE